MVRHIPRSLFGFLLDYPESVQDLFEDARNFVLDVDEQVYELVWDNYNALAVAYSPTRKLRDAYCHIAAYSTYVNLGFNQGVYLDDPKKLLRGSGKLIRHIKIDDSALLTPAVRRLVYNARDWSREMNPFPSRPSSTMTEVMSVSEKRRRPKLD